MGIYKIDETKCDGSPFCPVARSCEAQAVVAIKGTSGKTFPAPLKYQIRQDACRNCGKCLVVCPRRAVYQEA
jgi:MinD superfamily P-loop ATPase